MLKFAAMTFKVTQPFFKTCKQTRIKADHIEVALCTCIGNGYEMNKENRSIGVLI